MINGLAGIAVFESHRKSEASVIFRHERVCDSFPCGWANGSLECVGEQRRIDVTSSKVVERCGLMNQGLSQIAIDDDDENA
jgi:hypothetical protein